MSRLEDLILPIANQNDQRARVLEGPRSHEMVNTPQKSIPSTHVISGPVNFQIFERKLCSWPCYCSCHRRHYIQSPASVGRILGVLSIGYLGLKDFWWGCNETQCSNNMPDSVKITYSFPRWFLHRVVLMTASMSDGPELLLRVPHLRPRNSAWFRSAWDGDVGLMKKLLDDKQASGKIMPL